LIVHRLVVSLAGLLLWAATASAAPVDYEREIKPIFREHCAACHGVLKQKNSLRLDTGNSLRTGGDSGPAVVPGKPDDSLVVKVLTGRGDFQMPPEGEGSKLSAAKIDLITRWIAEGANSPADERPDEDPKKYWSYQPVQRPDVPNVPGAGIDNPIDRFLDLEQAARGLTARPETDKATQLRRVTIDLIGVPPTRDELHAFLADSSPDAYERVVDRLLASPLYGERWGRHWMDVWRYSDWYGSRGINEIRYSQRHIWRWRDWIVESLNADHGYDRMVQEMLAGDELAPGDPNVIRATGFLGRNWYKFDRNVWMFETVEQTAQAFLATTLKCTRCHDHKFDPLVQQDYYRFRAYFEPHDVRIDPLTGDLSKENDATLGPVLKTGVSLVFDKQPDVKTFVFQRGDNRYPDESQLMEPGVPAIFGVASVPVQPVDLPVAAWYPSLSTHLVASFEQEAAQSVAAAALDLDSKHLHVASLQKKLNQLAAADKAGTAGTAPSFGTVFTDRFETLRPDVWKTATGEWTHEPGKLLQKVPGSFVTMVADVTPPRDFMARVKYRTLEAGAIHSVGCFFDLVDLKDAQAIYSATNNTTSTIQAFHRQAGVEAYPSAGIIPWPIKIGQELTVEIAARGQLLNVWVNGELAIAYTMPLARQTGKFALWTHAASAEFYEVLIDPLAADFPLASAANEKIRSPFVGVSKANVEASILRATAEIPLAEKQLAIAQAEQNALAKRLAAERERTARPKEVPAAGNPAATGSPDPTPHALDAAQAERQVILLKAERDAMTAERQHAAVMSASYANDDAKAKAIMESQAKLDAANKAVEAAKAALEPSTTTYTPLGIEYPRQSTGRRTALAKWMTDPKHPRTARVAVNHIWLRHFGEALVPSVANFGLNGQRPSHPQLLDWLATEFTDSGWSMKTLHRLIVTSAAYRRETTDGPDADKNRAIDPRNRYLWRMNSRRMESEVVRDSVLALGGRLDHSFGGPEIPETNGELTPRRSLYFRSTPNEKMPFLEVFDQANPNECYRRQESVMPQQALALTNSLLSSNQARVLAEVVLHDLERARQPANISHVIPAAFEHVLARPPKPAELAAAEKMLGKYAASSDVAVPAAAMQSLIHVLLNHNDFVTIR
jgi:mono/diheme cytochrome c family protein